MNAGTRLGPYQILAPLGAGGMGEVYRARDTKLDREVAIKILPEALARDPERLARFEREAKLLASLNHPNIAQIYGVEEHALVMELVAGETLRGPLPIETALNYAKQIAEALEAAHEKGITHRDLKPANVMVTSEDVVKVLDFGLAKAAEESTGANDAANSPTLTMSPTRAGMILGTASYMAPEQARGQPVDRRADIWAFGCVLYELITGKSAFQGESVADIFSAVLKTEPDLSLIPARVRKLVARCLTKDRKQRLQAIGEARIAIEEALSGKGHETEPGTLAAVPGRNLALGTLAAALGLALIVSGVLLWRATRPVERPLQPLVRLSVDLGPDAVAGQFTTTAISPDGTRLVFPAKNSEGKLMLATRLLSETKPALLSGTGNGRDPFFSPDGRWIGFFADGKMKTISVQGGAPVVLCDAPDAHGGDWGGNGFIVASLSLRGALSRVPAEGGIPQRVTKQLGASVHRWPQSLPGGEAVLFTLSPSGIEFENASIAVLSLNTGEIKTVIRGGYFGRYLPTGDSSGHLVYVHDGVLFGVPFDPLRLEIRGAAVPLLEDFVADPTSGAGQFDFAKSGNLVYRTGKASAQSYPVWWLAESGKTEPLMANPGLYRNLRFSPDGQRLVLVQVIGNDNHLIVYDWRRDTISRLAVNARQHAYPQWSPDGQHILFRFLSASDTRSLGWVRADGAGDVTSLLNSQNNVIPYSFFPNGRRFAYHEVDPESGFDLWTLALDVSDRDHPKAGKPELFLRTPSNERHPAASPDGQWIAYQSDESGRSEVYVRPFPGPGGKWQISNAGGILPIWSRDGHQLFFESLDNRIMVTDCAPKTESFFVGKPRVWSDQRLHDVGGNLNYDLAPDGKRFAIFPDLTPLTEENRAVHIVFLENFFDELRRRAPVGNK